MQAEEHNDLKNYGSCKPAITFQEGKEGDVDAATDSNTVSKWISTECVDDCIEDQGDDQPRLAQETSSFFHTTPLQARLLGLVCLLCTAIASEGYDLGVINGVLPRIRHEFSLNPSEEGFLVAIGPLSMFIGAGVHSLAADYFGRRPALSLAVALLTIGPSVMASGLNVTMIMFGRFICGLGLGGGFMVVTMTIAEISPTNKRGRLVAAEEIALNAGMVGSFLVSWLLVGSRNDWRWMFIIGSLLALPLGIALLVVYISGADESAFIPETPRWLALQGRFQSAQRVLERFQGVQEARRKIHQLETLCKQEEQSIPWSQVLWPWRDKRLTRLLLVGSLVATSEMVCGATTLAYYSSSIMAEEMGRSNAYFATVLMGTVRFAGVIVAALSMDSIGRRTLLLSSASVVTTACIFVAVCVRYDIAVSVTLPFGLCLLMLGFVMGLGSVPFVYISEVFPNNMRGKGMLVATFWCRMAGAACGMAYPLLLDCCGIAVLFFLQAIVNLVLLCMIYFFVLETKGVSLEKTHRLFDSSK